MNCIKTNTKQKREKMCELVFEKFQAPGFYMSKNGVLSAYGLFIYLINCLFIFLFE